MTIYTASRMCRQMRHLHTANETSSLSKDHETRDSLAVPVRSLSWFFPSICRNSLLKSALQPHIAKITLKSLILKVEDHSRSLMLTSLQSWSLLLVMISIMSVDIWNYFSATRANSGKITTFRKIVAVELLLPHFAHFTASRREWMCRHWVT